MTFQTWKYLSFKFNNFTGLCAAGAEIDRVERLSDDMQEAAH